MLRVFGVTGTLLLGIVLLAQAQPSNPGMTPFGSITLGHCAKFGPSTRFQLQDAGACGGGGGGMAIGGVVTSGSAKSVLFVDGSGDLAQDNANLNYDVASKTLQVGSSSNIGKLSLGVPAANGNPAGVLTLLGPQTNGIGASYSLEFPQSQGSGALVNDGTGHLAWSIFINGSSGNFGDVQVSDGAGSLTSEPGFNVDPINHVVYLGKGPGVGVIVADAQYVIETPSTGDTIDMTSYNPVFTEIIDPAGTLATLTIKLPDAAVDGQILRLKFSQIITALTINGNTGDSVKGAPTTVALGGLIDCQFTGTAGSGTWYC